MEEKISESGSGHANECDNTTGVMALKDAASKNDSENNESNVPTDEYKDDYPNDFFDDFMKDDFMLGLDIIDRVDDEDPEEPNCSSEAREERKTEGNACSKASVEDKVKKSEHVDVTSKKEKAEKFGQENGNKAKKKVEDKKDSKNKADKRRDPEKTKKAIQKDKIKTVKDKEKRLITDIVETGLVPPGMELEVSLKDVPGLKPIRKDNTTNAKKQKSKSKSIERKRHMQDRYSSRSNKKRKHSKSGTPKRAPKHRSRSRSRYYLGSGLSARRRRSRSRSPLYRVKSREPERSFDYYRRESYRKRERRYKSRSPLYKSVKKEEKMSFLEELAVKLNETRVSAVLGQSGSYSAAPIGPPPYDQNYSTNYGSYASDPLPESTQFDPDESFYIGGDPSRSYTEYSSWDFEGRRKFGSAADLLLDKTMKLSDIFSIVPRTQVDSSAWQNTGGQIEVVQRCQDAIGAFEKKNFMGPLIVEKTRGRGSARSCAALPFTAAELNEPFRSRCEYLLKMAGLTWKPMEADVITMSPPWMGERAATTTSAVQTDRELTACKECAKRRQMSFESRSVQTSGPTLTFSMSTQVNEADFYSMIPKTQSLACLTPAQLLGKQSMPVGERRNRYVDHKPHFNYNQPTPNSSFVPTPIPHEEQYAPPPQAFPTNQAWPSYPAGNSKRF